MKYSAHLRKVFKDTNLEIEDLLLLENFQIMYLPERVPHKEFATLLREYPVIHRFLLKKEPSFKPFIDKILQENLPVKNAKTIEKYCNEVIWEIGELIIYNKFPEVYDAKIKFTWEIAEIVSPTLLKNKIVVDAGAGSGMLSLLLAKYAKTVYAVEPLSSFRNFLHKKINAGNVKNIYPMEGFLEAIPLPDQSIDFLFTSNALGWNFEKEQQEIQRVIKRGGQVIHLMRAFDKNATSPHHTKLIEWKYNFEQLEAEGFKAKYVKTV